MNGPPTSTFCERQCARTRESMHASSILPGTAKCRGGMSRSHVHVPVVVVDAADAVHHKHDAHRRAGGDGRSRPVAAAGPCAVVNGGLRRAGDGGGA